MSTRYMLTLCTALFVGGACLIGWALVLGKSEEKMPDDLWLTAKTKIALFADTRLQGSEILIETTQGMMLIRGNVESATAKQAADGIARGVDGVKSVKNDLQVIVPSRREAIDDTDASIGMRVHEQIVKDLYLRDAGIDAQTQAGVVSLRGELPNLMMSAQASWTAWQVPGVRSVKNTIIVKEKS